ncbi:hypothetical protein ACIBL5_37730 [Streptomyces sp. NPDC050516]|uniref:hypothetical protein n=1 Tax=Streptomyces sp. NPDC050516 TaxID=3365621 RepID=UPI0037893F3B
MEFHDRLRDRVRQTAGRDPEPTAGIIDAQSVKGAASVPAASRGFDGGKKVNGRKRDVAEQPRGVGQGLLQQLDVLRRDDCASLKGGGEARTAQKGRGAFWQASTTSIRRADKHTSNCRMHPI